MIEKLMSRSRTTEVDAFLMRLVGAYKNTSLNTDTFLSGVMLELEEKSKLLTQAVNRMKVESDLEEKDDARDTIFRSLYYLVQGFVHHPDKSISGEAAKLMAILDHPGLSITNESYATESSLLSSLFNDLATAELQASINALSGCADLIGALQTAAADFEATRLKYDETKAGEGTLANATAIKKEVLKLINNKLVVYLRAMIQVNEELYGDFTRTAAEIIDSNNLVVKKRTKKPEAE